MISPERTFQLLVLNRQKTETDFGEFSQIFKPEYDQKKASLDAKRIEDVRRLFDLQNAIENDRDEKLADHQLKLTESVERVRTLEAALKTARIDEDRQRTALWNKSFEYQRRLASNTAEVSKLAPKIVTSFRAEMLVEIKHTRQKFDSQERRQTGHWTGKQKIIIETNDQTVEARLDAIRDAIGETEAAAFLLLPETDMTSEWMNYAQGYRRSAIARFASMLRI